MPVACLPLILVFLKVPEYLRDLLSLPLLGERILWVDLYLLVLGCTLCFPVKPLVASYRSHAGPEPLRWSVLFALFSAAGSLLLINIARSDANHHFVIQLLSMVAATYYLSMVLERWRLESFLRVLMAILLPLLALQAVLYMLDRSGVGINPDWLGRNHLPYVAVIGYLLARLLGKVALRRSFFWVALVLTGLNSTRGAALFLLSLLILCPLNALIPSKSRLRSILALATLGIIAIAPLLAYYAMLLVLNISSDELSQLQEYRYFIADTYGSLISRLMSAALTFQTTIDQGGLLGLGVQKAADLTFFGYPVHNYLISSIAIYGIAGAAVDILLFYLMYRTAKIYLPLGALGVYVLVLANDLYAVIALLMSPLVLGLVSARRGERPRPRHTATPLAVGVPARA
jgi:hypothetical protein